MPSNNKTEQSVQEIQNQSFDNELKVGVIEPVVYNSATGNLDRMKQPTVPTDTQPVSFINDTPVAETGSITAKNQTVVINVEDYSNVIFGITGTYAGVTLYFEASMDGSTWYSILATRVDSNTIESYTGSSTIANTTRAWEASVNGWYQFRIRCSAYTSGTVSVTVRKSVIATEPVPSIGSHAVTLAGGTAYSIARATSGGYARLHYKSLASTNSYNVKSSAGQLYDVYIFNSTSSTLYFKLYSKATAPTVGTDTPIEVYPLKAGELTVLNFSPIGNYIATGIGFGITGALADNDTTAIGANEVVVDLHYA